MSLLDLVGRSWTVFDPENKEHRRYYYQFVQTGTWGVCPFRFAVPDDHGDLVTMIQRSLVGYYMKKEFGTDLVVEKPHDKVRQKR
jgi:hypothetical protein